jgi:hypothetical protein
MRYKRWDMGLARVLVAAAASAALLSSSAAAQPAGCTGPAARQLLARFVSAFDAGDLRGLDALFAPPETFVWYSSNVPGPRTSPAAEDRGTLLAYFRRRHQQRDRITLLSFRFNGTGNGLGNFEFKLRRSAADYRGGTPFRIIGKGAAMCSPTLRIAVLSLGGPGSG